MMDVVDQLVDVVKMFVDDFEQVELEIEDFGGMVLFNVIVVEEEFGWVIGCQGCMVCVLCMLFEVCGIDSGVYYDFEVVEF